MLELNRLMLKGVVGGICECACIYYELDPEIWCDYKSTYEVNYGLMKDADECKGACKDACGCIDDRLKDWECR